MNHFKQMTLTQKAKNDCEQNSCEFDLKQRFKLTVTG